MTCNCIGINKRVAGKGYWSEDDIKEIQDAMSQVDNDFILKYSNFCYKPPEVVEDDTKLSDGITVVC